MVVYRLYKNNYIAQPLSAEGARRAGGRCKGYPILYTSATPELALLKIVAHLNPLHLPSFQLLVLDIPETHHLVSLADLPANWQDEQQTEGLQSYLQDWFEEPDRLSVSVPSASVDRSRNYLLHILHSSFEEASKIVENAPFRIDGRLLKTNG